MAPSSNLDLLGFVNTAYLFEDDVDVSCNQLGNLLPLCGLY